MGQYYRIVNVSRKEYLDPLKFGDGLKLVELSCGYSLTLSGLCVLLADGNGRGGGDFPDDLPFEGEWIGRWANCRIVVAGDYADDCKFVPLEDLHEFFARMPDAKDHLARYKRIGPNLYEVAKVVYRDISEYVLATLLQDRYLREDILRKVARLVRLYGGPEAAREDSFITAVNRAFEIRGESLDLWQILLQHGGGE